LRPNFLIAGRWLQNPARIFNEHGTQLLISDPLLFQRRDHAVVNVQIVSTGRGFRNIPFRIPVKVAHRVVRHHHAAGVLRCNRCDVA
jgi:hypothetical protein